MTAHEVFQSRVGAGVVTEVVVPVDDAPRVPRTFNGEEPDLRRVAVPEDVHDGSLREVGYRPTVSLGAGS